MNIPYDIAADIPIPPAVHNSAVQLENCVRRHPGGTLLLAAGLGIAGMLIVRALTPPPRSRALGLLEDIQDQLTLLAKEGRHAVDEGVDRLGDLHLERSFGKLSRRFKQLFH